MRYPFFSLMDAGRVFNHQDIQTGRRYPKLESVVPLSDSAGWTAERERRRRLSGGQVSTFLRPSGADLSSLENEKYGF